MLKLHSRLLIKIYKLINNLKYIISTFIYKQVQ